MATTLTRAHKTQERKLRLENRPVWVCCFVENSTGLFIGVRFKWLDGPWALSTDEHFTEDGQTYKRLTTSFCLAGLAIEKEICEIETNPEKLASLAKLKAAYEESLGHAAFARRAN